MVKRRTRKLKWSRYKGNKPLKLGSQIKADSRFGIENLNRIHSSEAFLDSTLGRSYAWKTSLSTIGDDVESSIDHNEQLGRIRSLKEICTVELARNAVFLSSSCLEEGTWLLWKDVWNRILNMEQDSFKVFNAFALKFASYGGFRCHGSLEEKGASPKADVEKIRNLKQEAIVSNMTPHCRLHRLENFFSNIDFADFVQYLNSLMYNHYVLLDLSLLRSSLNRDDLLRILRIQNLVALDISGVQIVDNAMLKILSTNLKEGKLRRLEILRLKNCPFVSVDGIYDLFKTAEGTCSNLSVIECDHTLIRQTFAAGFQSNLPKKVIGIKESEWLYLADMEMSHILSRLPLGLKYHFYRKSFRDSSKLEGVKLDILFNGEKLSTENIDIHSFLSLWSSRISRRNRIHKNSTQIYLRNDCLSGNNLQVSNVVQGPRAIDKTPILHPSLKVSSSRIGSRRKIAKPIIKTNFKKFFEL